MMSGCFFSNCYRDVAGFVSIYKVDLGVLGVQAAAFRELLDHVMAVDTWEDVPSSCVGSRFFKNSFES